MLIEDVALLNYDLGFGLLKQGLSDLPRLSTNVLLTSDISVEMIEMLY